MNDSTTIQSTVATPGSLNQWEILFVATLSVLISIANVLMGCELDLNVVVSTIKRPIAPAIGFFTQFILMPIIAYLVSQMVLVPRGLHAFALGLFVTGCAPAGGASNFWTLLLDGNVHLSVTMTFISMIASVFMIPFWMKAVGYKFVESVSHSAVKVPYRNIMTSLIVLIVPLLIGMGIARKWPNIAAKARRALRPFIIFVLIFVIALGTLTNLHIFKQISLPALLSGFLLPFGGFMFGCITSILLGQKPRDVTAIAIETGIQNTGIAIMLLKFSFPDADTAMLIPVIVACFTPFPLLFSYGVHSLIKYVKNRPSSLIDVEKENQSVIFHANENVHKTAHCQSYDERPLIRKSPDLQTEEGRVEYLEQVLDQVLLPGVIPD